MDSVERRERLLFALDIMVAVCAGALVALGSLLAVQVRVHLGLSTHGRWI